MAISKVGVPKCHPGDFSNECLSVSGMYMGEVVRQVLADLKHEGLIFKVGIWDGIQHKEFTLNLNS